MSDEQKTGILDLEIQGKGVSAYILNLDPLQEDGNPWTKESIITQLEQANITYGYDESVIDYYLKRMEYDQKPLDNVLIASFKPAIRKASELLKLSFDSSVKIYETHKWKIINDFFTDPNLDRFSEFPFPVKLVNKGEKIGVIETTTEEKIGKNIFGNEITPKRTDILEFHAGEGVFYNNNSKTFIAGITGYLVIKDNTLHIRTPYFMTKDKMKFYFFNFNRINNESPSNNDVIEFMEKAQISKKYSNNVLIEKVNEKGHILLAEGKFPTKGVDASVDIKVDFTKTVGKMDDKGRIDFKEKEVFHNVSEDQLLAVKTLPQFGSDGVNLLDEIVSAKPPKDVVIRPGSGTKKEVTDTEMKIISAIDGIFEYKSDTIAVFPTINISGDVDLESGNIRSKANIHISRNVLAGFEVISEKNITINGSVEDNCIIKSKGDIYIKGGVIGENTVIDCGGNFTAKFVESATINCKGMMTIQRFLMGATINCHEKILVFGQGVNLNERGAIVDCKINVRNSLIAPAVGSDSGLKTEIHFGYDKALFLKIDNLKSTCAKLSANIDEIKDKFEIDITAENVHTLMKNFARTVKDDIIKSIQEINKIKSKFNMMEKILKKELDHENELLENAFVEISIKITPPLIMEIHNVQKTIDSVEPKGKYYFDMQSRLIERSAYVGISE